MIKIIIRWSIYFLTYHVINKVIGIHLDSDSAFAAICVGLEAGIIGLTNIKNSKQQVSTKLFIQFNEKYSNINEKLEKCINILQCDKNKELDKQIFQNLTSIKDFKSKGRCMYFIIEDYYNLCCEQNYCYKKRQIPYEIWKSWHNGMMHWYKQENLKLLIDLWKTDTIENQNSFYGVNPFVEETTIEIIKNFIIKKINMVGNIFY